ncbi:hypothetical protein D3C72_1643800 [compost metagenome]
MVGQHVVTRQRPYQYATRIGCGGNRHIVRLVRQVEDQVQPGIVIEFTQGLLTQMLLDKTG